MLVKITEGKKRGNLQKGGTENIAAKAALACRQLLDKCFAQLGQPRENADKPVMYLEGYAIHEAEALKRVIEKDTCRLSLISKMDVKEVSPCRPISARVIVVKTGIEVREESLPDVILNIIRKHVEAAAKRVEEEIRLKDSVSHFGKPDEELEA